MLSITALFLHAFKQSKPMLSFSSSTGCPTLIASIGGTFTKDQLRQFASHSRGQLLDMVKSVVPSLEFSMHKGQAGRVAVIGGCKEYTGAPYFAAISALKVGADLSHVFCTSDAATVIKTYSPELIVHPVLDSPTAVEEMSEWLPRFHSLVVGPGLGRDETIIATTKAIIKLASERQIPIVIDADGLHFVTQDPSIIEGNLNVILTPNVVEFGRLYRKVFSRDPDMAEPVIATKELCQHLGHVTIVHKGLLDIISDGTHVLVCAEPGSPRRCGGQGDLLSGSLGILALWAKQAIQQQAKSNSALQTFGWSLCAAYGACSLTRACSGLAFREHGRAMTTSDMIQHIHTAFEKLYVL